MSDDHDHHKDYELQDIIETHFLYERNTCNRY